MEFTAEEFVNKIMNMNWNDYTIRKIEIRHEENVYTDYMINGYIPTIIVEDLSIFAKKFKVDKMLKFFMTYRAIGEKLFIYIKEIEYEDERILTIDELLNKGYSIRQINDYFKEKENKDYAQR